VSNTFLRYEKASLRNIDEDGEAAAEDEAVAEQNDEVAIEATEEEQCQANLRYKTTTNTRTQQTWPWPIETLSSMRWHLKCSLWFFSDRGLPGSWVNFTPVIPYWGPYSPIFENSPV
jgi:hypothetical protein